MATQKGSQEASGQGHRLEEGKGVCLGDLGVVFEFPDAEEPLGLVKQTFHAEASGRPPGEPRGCGPLGELPPWLEGAGSSVRSWCLCFSLPGTMSRILTSETGNESQTER